MRLRPRNLRHYDLAISALVLAHRGGFAIRMVLYRKRFCHSVANEEMAEMYNLHRRLSSSEYC